MGAWTRWMWWAEHIGLAGCSCAHRPSQSLPCQSILATTICKICKICIWTWSMQLYATWASSFLIFHKNRDKGTIVLLPCLIVLWNKGEEEQHIAEPNIVDPQLETAFVDARWPNHDHIPTVGHLNFLCPIRRVECILRCLACFADSSNWPENIQNMQFM